MGALVSPAAIKEYMFGTRVNSEWNEGSPISWKGQWQGKSYEDKGTILQFRPARRLQYSHYGLLWVSGQTRALPHSDHRSRRDRQRDGGDAYSGSQRHRSCGGTFREKLEIDVGRVEEIRGKVTEGDPGAGMNSGAGPTEGLLLRTVHR